MSSLARRKALSPAKGTDKRQRISEEVISSPYPIYLYVNSNIAM